MKRWRFDLRAATAACAAVALLMGASGCGTAGSAASDLGLEGAGGVVGYQLSNNRIGGAAAGAAVGYLASRVTQAQVQKALKATEQRGYDQALNQAVKQQYWIIQNQQRSRSGATSTRYVPVQLPQRTVNGVIYNPTVVYVPAGP